MNFRELVILLLLYRHSFHFYLISPGRHSVHFVGGMRHRSIYKFDKLYCKYNGILPVLDFCR